MNGNVFISYAKKDSNIRDQLLASFHRRGLHTWVDVNNIRWGEDFSDEIEQGIMTCDYIVLVLSHHYFESDWCNDELKLSINAKKFESSGKKSILPLVIKGCESYLTGV